MKTKDHQALKSIMSSNKQGKKGTKEITSTIRLTSEKKRKISSGKNIGNLSSFEQRLDIPKKIDQQHSHRVTKENKLIHHASKNSDIPTDRNIGEYNKQMKLLISNSEDKRSFSLKKQRDSSSEVKGVNSFSVNSTYNNKIKPNNPQNIAVLEKTIYILLYYIKTERAQFELTLKKVVKEKDEIIKKLKINNDFLIQENKKLKFKLLEILQQSKLFTMNETQRDKNKILLLSQLFTENSYLRKANASLSHINSEQFCHKISYNNQENNHYTKTAEEETNNPFQNYKNENSNPLLLKAKHKRQRTHLNLSTMRKEDEDDPNNSQKNSNTILSLTSNSSLGDTIKNEDVFGQTLDELTNFSKTLKRNNDSKKNVLDSVGSPKEFVSPTTSQQLSSNKKQLYYRTPRDKEKKKIEFTK